MNTVITGNGIVKEYWRGEVVNRVLKGVDFEIGSDEFIVILGPSGSGKSTLLNIIGGIEVADGGRLFYENQEIDFRNKAVLTQYRREHIGFVFQFYNLLPALTVRENIQLAAELGKSPLDVQELINAVSLDGRENQYPSQLSGGQQQRVAIARALCKNPDVLLCDEPTGALDSKTSVQILKLLWDFNRKYHKAIVMVTHNTEIRHIANRVFNFKDGVIAKIDVNEHPLDPTEVNWG